MLDHVEAAFEVDGQHPVPIRFFHAHDEFVRRDAGIVDENIDLAEILDDPVDRLLCGGEVGNVALIIARRNARLFQRIERLFCRGFVAVIDDCDVRFFCGEGARDGRADPPARARDERDSVF